MVKKYHGVIPAIITPIDETEKVDEHNFRRCIDHCIQHGIHGLFVCGTNGESLGLTQEQRNRAIQISLDQVKGRIPVIAGVMDSSTQRVIENIKYVESIGGTCVAITPIFYARHASQYETIRHFETILKATDIDIMIYNIPAFTGLTLTAKTVQEIAQLSDKIVGYKDSSGQYEEFLKVVTAYKDTPFSVLEGATEHAISALLMGADGFVPALAPAFPEIFVKGYEAGKSGDLATAKIYNELISETSKLLKMSKNATSVTKYVISLLGLTDERVTMPQEPVNPVEKIKIKQHFETIIKQYEAMK